MKAAPWFWLVAGPNGAGKSTTARLFLPRLRQIVNPDEIASGLSPDIPSRAALRAGREALALTSRLLTSREDFARETTLSGRSIITLLERVRSDGYRLGLIYIGLRSPELAIARFSSTTHRVPHGPKEFLKSSMVWRYIDKRNCRTGSAAGCGSADIA